MFYLFSEKHPGIGIAFNVFSSHLADSAIEFLNSNIGSPDPQLNLRTKKALKFDKKLIAAKAKLINFVNALPDNQTMPMSYLLQ